MASYATPAQLRDYIPQGGNDMTDAFLQQFLDRATSIIDEYLGFSYAPWPLLPSTRTVFSQGTSILQLPAHREGSVTAILNPEGVAVEADSYLERESGSVYWLRGYLSPWGWRANAGWGFKPYTVTAVWGYGPPPKAVEEVCLELAKDLLHERDQRGSSDIVGVEGSGGVAVGYKGALTKRQKMILDAQKSRRAPAVIA